VLDPPVAFIQKISQTGEVLINFTEEMTTVPELDFINEGTVMVDGVALPVVNLELKAAESSNQRKKISKWTVISQTSKQLRIQLFFEETLSVSTEGLDDILMAVFNDPVMFRAQSGLQILQENREISKALPSQLPPESRSFKALVDSFFSYGADPFTNIELKLHTLIRIPLSHLFSMISTLQIILMFSTCKVQLTANVGIFFNQMMQIAAFDIFETAPLLNDLLGLEQDGKVLNSNFETLGYESLYFLHNMGSLLFVFVLYPVAIAFTWLCAKFTYSHNVSKWGIKKQRQLFYSFFIGILTESYSMLAVSCCINIKFLTWGS